MAPRLQLIDHGAALTFHHSWAPGREEQVQRFATRPYDVADHALLECAPDVAAASAEFARLDWPTLIGDAVAAVPDEWLAADAEVWGDQHAVRAAYGQFLMARIAARGTWVPALVEDVEAGPTRDALGHRVSARRSSGPPEWIPELTIGREGS